MRDLGDRDSRAGESSDLGDLGTTSATWVSIYTNVLVRPSHDAADHVGGNRDVLRSQVRVVGQVGGRGLGTPPGLSGAERDAAPADSSLAVEASGSTETSNRGPPDTASRASDGLGAKSASEDAGITSCSGVVLDGALTPLPVLEQALGDLEDGRSDSVNGSLNLDDSFGRLREHLLGSDHARARSVLDLLDLESGPADDGTHEVVGDQQSDRGESPNGGRRKRRVGKRSLKQETGNLSVRAGDLLSITRSAEDTVLDAWNDLGDAGFDARGVSDVRDCGSAFADDDTGFLGADERTEGELMLVVERRGRGVGVGTAVDERRLGGLGGNGVWRGQLGQRG